MVRVRSLGSLALCGVAAGVLLAAAAFPTVGLAGAIAATAAQTFVDLPSTLTAPPAAQRSAIYAADGTLISSFYDENRHDVALSEIAPVMQQAIVAAEDSRFYQHRGVDLRGLLRALVTDARHRTAAQGGSTLTMQYVRNVLKEDPDLTPQQRQEATSDTPERKLQEIRYATALEQKLSKQEILDRYLNIAYFGDGAYGIDAASRTYFSKPPAQLTLPEAALLAGLVQAPDSDNPVTGDRIAALARRSYTLDAMAAMHVVTPAQAAGAKAEPLTLHPSPPPPNDCTAARPDWGFFCDYLRQWWDAQPQFGASVADRDRALREGGYRIVTTLDPRVQAAALAQARAVYPDTSPRALPIAVMQPGTGRVLAMAVNRSYSLAPNPGGRAYPNTVDQLVAGGNGVLGYPAGSTFKLFTMLAALSGGLPLDTGFDAPAALPTRWPASGPASCDGHWCPANDNPSWMDGYRTMWDGYGRSVNTYFVWLEQRIGPQRAVEMARRLGIALRAPADAAFAGHADDWGSFTLGVADTTPLDLAAAYATVAAQGTYCAPLPVVSITDAAGNPVQVTGGCHPVLAPDVAAAAADAARCPVGQQSAYHRCDGGTAPQVDSILGGRPVAGKTGSSENNTTETFVGFTTQVVAAGIAADPADPGDAVGAGVAARVDTVVASTLAAAVAGLPWREFPVPSPGIAFGAAGSGG
jgi:membrane peptidoglycan carboxypeptidase